MSYPSEQSVINNQDVIVNQLVVPSGTNLSAGPGSLDPVLGSLAQDPNLPGDIFVGTGVAFKNISGAVNTLVTPTVVGDVVVYGNTDGTEIADSGLSLDNVFRSFTGPVLTNNIVSFADTTGKYAKDSGVSITSYPEIPNVLLTSATNPNLTIASFSYYRMSFPVLPVTTTFRVATSSNLVAVNCPCTYTSAAGIITTPPGGFNRTFPISIYSTTLAKAVNSTITFRIDGGIDINIYEAGAINLSLTAASGLW